jgi:hypothetical protein
MQVFELLRKSYLYNVTVSPAVKKAQQATGAGFSQRRGLRLGDLVIVGLLVKNNLGDFGSAMDLVHY